VEGEKLGCKTILRACVQAALIGFLSVKIDVRDFKTVSSRHSVPVVVPRSSSAPFFGGAY
jgi:hypothetical protein